MAKLVSVRQGLQLALLLLITKSFLFLQEEPHVCASSCSLLPAHPLPTQLFLLFLLRSGLRGYADG